MFAYKFKKASTQRLVNYINLAASILKARGVHIHVKYQ